RGPSSKRKPSSHRGTKLPQSTPSRKWNWRSSLSVKKFISHRAAARAGSVERAALARALDQEGSGREALAVATPEGLQHLHREARPEVVEVAEGPAQEGGEPEAEDRPRVAVARRAQDAFLQAERGLGEEREDEPLLDLARLHRAAGAAAGQQRVHARVH